MDYHWNFGAVLDQWPVFLLGLWGTLRVSFVAIVLGTTLGGVIAAMRMAGNAVVRAPATIYVEFYRNTPAIVHFFWFFYALPIVANVSMGPWQAAVLALTTQSSALYSEVLRGGIGSIGRQQWEGARALGMSDFQALVRVILPQAARRMVPPFIERSFEIVKTSSLASTLAYPELLYEATQVNEHVYRPLEVYTVLGAIYFLLLFSASLLSKTLEAHFEKVAA